MTLNVFHMFMDHICFIFSDLSVTFAYFKIVLLVWSFPCGLLGVLYILGINRL